MSEIEEKFNQAQQELIDAFKVKMKKASDEVLGSLYSDVCNWAATDAHTNFHNYLRDEMRDSLRNEIVTQNGHYSWAHSIRMEILKNHKEELQNKIIADLQEKVERLQKELQQVYEQRSW